MEVVVDFGAHDVEEFNGAVNMVIAEELIAGERAKFDGDIEDFVFVGHWVTFVISGMVFDFLLAASACVQLR